MLSLAHGTPQHTCRASVILQGFAALRQQILELAGDAKKFPPTRLPPLWGEADRLVKRMREEGRNIMSLKDLVAGLRTEAAGELGEAASRLAGQSWEDSRNTVVSTVGYFFCTK